MAVASIAYGNVLNGLTQNEYLRNSAARGGNPETHYSQIVVFFFVSGLRLNKDLIFFFHSFITCILNNNIAFRRILEDKHDPLPGETESTTNEDVQTPKLSQHSPEEQKVVWAT